MKLKNKKYFHYKGPVYDLQVNTEDHSYNIENVVVHNSAAASVVCWALGITGLNPMEHNLIFERFINPERKVMADIDWDSEQGARDKILEYLISKYGRESVSNVATFSLYGPKSALQDMSRGLKKETGMDSILMRKITKLEGIEDAEDLKMFFSKVERTNPDSDVQHWISNNQDTIDFAQRIIGQMRQLGTHAGGIVVTPGPIYNYIPVTRGSGNMVTAFKEADGSSKDLTELGILKLDVLGLKTLNILKECVSKIKEDTGEDLTDKIYHLDLTDKKIINYFAEGNNYGIFQMDRSKMFTEKMKADSFDDIVAVNAMNRPGPLEKFLNKYGYWKSIDTGAIEIDDEERERVDKERYPFEFMRKTLGKTYGCLLYQEQFMQLICDAAGFTYGESDSFRRVFGWKEDHPKYYTIKGYYDRLEAGMEKMGYSKEDTAKFIQYCREFTGYSFNVAHATTYAYIAYQTLFLKVYYPSYFYAAMLNMENDIEIYQEIISDAKKNQVEILPHSITKSVYGTRAEGLNAIRLGFKMIKGLGGAVEGEIEELKLNECKTIDEILQKPFKKLNTTAIQNLIDLGCFDEFGIQREKITILKDLYQDDKILFWFERKKQALRLETIPKSLLEHFEEKDCLRSAIRVKGEEKPNVALLNLLIDKLVVPKTMSEEKQREATIKKQNELIGFSLYNDEKIEKFDAALRIKGFKPLKEFNNDNHDYYFIINKVEQKATKNGKSYLHLVINDGANDIKVRCWQMLSLEENKIYTGKFKKDTFGWTLEGRGVYKQT
jgi:DNA polymerase-3 subunit alpha